MRSVILLTLFWMVLGLAPTLATAQQHQSPHPMAQRPQDHPVGAQPHAGGGFRAGALVGYVIIPTATTHGKEYLILPSLGLDLEYWFDARWGIGLHNDLELMVFEVETEKDIFVEREYPLLVTLDVLWKPWKGLVLFGGPGVEFEPSEHFWVGRAGVEYEIPIGGGWDVFPAAFYDFRIGAYNSFSFGLGIGKFF